MIIIKKSFPSSILLLISLVVNSSNAHKHSTHPLMLLVSFDGFRWDYLEKFDLPNFKYLKSTGSHADYIHNSFATVTFPNHWTIVTGLYEESHGIVHNEMYDPLLDETFQSGTKESRDHKWYGQNKLAEPIWVTNQKAGNGRKSAASWVGSGVKFEDQAPINIPYNMTKPYNELIDEFIALFVKPDEPINFGAVYFDEPDATGHKYGPYSKQMEDKLKSLDKTLGYLIEELKSHHLLEKLNLIVTSDHGMEKVSKDKAIYLESLVDTSLFKAYGRRSSYSLFLKQASDLEKVYKSLAAVENIIVFKKADIPDALHYKNNVRIGDLVIIAKLGYTIVVDKELEVDWKNHHGDHGYLNDKLSMYPIFLAHGPAIRKDHKIKSFYNVDIYPLMCLLLGVQPATNNGNVLNVLDMVVYHAIESSFSMIYLLIFLVPLCLVMTSCFFICMCRTPEKAADSTMYTSVGQHEMLIRDGDDEPDEL